MDGELSPQMIRITDFRAERSVRIVLHGLMSATGVVNHAMRATGVSAIFASIKANHVLMLFYL